MIIKLKELLESYDSIMKFSSLKMTELKLPYTEIRKIMILAKAVKEEFKLFQKLVNELIEKHGQLNEKTGQYEIKSGTNEFKAYKEEYDNILENEIPISEFEKMDIKIDPSKIELSPIDMINLELFFNWS